MKVGMAVGLLGGLLSFFAMAYLLNINDGANVIYSAGVYLATATVFFAMAGGFSKTSQWSQNVLIGYSFLTFGVCVGFFAAGFVPDWFAAISIILCIVAIACAAVGGTGVYLANKDKA